MFRATAQAILQPNNKNRAGTLARPVFRKDSSVAISKEKKIVIETLKNIIAEIKNNNVVFEIEVNYGLEDVTKDGDYVINYKTTNEKTLILSWKVLK